MRLKIDAQDVEVPPGLTVKEAAKYAGIKIPGLCDHPDLKPYGGCRLCLVEIDGIRGFPSSCTMPASEGMVVKTDTPALRSLRESVLEMLLSAHPCNCLTCERAGKCDDIREAMRKVPQSMGCRYCPQDGRCELQEAVEQIGLAKVELHHIGTSKELVRSPFFDRDPNLCILCGRCIRACEDRGLGVISFIFRSFETEIGTAFDKPLEDSGCKFCGACVDVCPTGALTERAGKWAGVPEKIMATTCPYCSANCQIGLEVKNERLIRARPEKSKLCVRGRFGLEFVGRERLQRPLVKKNGRFVETSWEEALDWAVRGLSTYSGEGFTLFTSGVLSNEALYLAKKFAGQVMKGEAVAADISSVDSRPEDLEGPMVIVGDLAATNPAIELSLRPRKPIVVSAFVTLLARKAAVWLKPSPGEEGLLLMALAHAMNGQVEAASPVPREDIDKAAEGLRGASVVVGPDLGPDVISAASVLAKATGGRLCLVGQNCNSRGAAALGLSLKYNAAMNALSSGALRTAYMAGYNPAREQSSLINALSRLDFLIVQDLFLTETARLADVVLPAASFAEIDGTFLASGGNILPLKPAISPMGRSDWKILAELGRRMGATGFDFIDSQAVLEEMLASIKNLKIGILPQAIPAASRLKHLPLLALTPSLFQFGSGTRISKVSDLRYLSRELRVEINPRDAKIIGAKEGDPLQIDGERGIMRASVKISHRVSPGILRMPGVKSGTIEIKVKRDV
jgi:predicted molibdopterin-dependent oxidoreductase YjgC